MALSGDKKIMVDIKVREYDVKYFDERGGAKEPEAELMETREKLSLSLVEAIRYLAGLLK